MCTVWKGDIAHEKFTMITMAEARVQCEFPSDSLPPGSLVRKTHRVNKASKREE